MKEPQVICRFYEELNDFLPHEWHKTDFTYELNAPRSVKDLIESIGVPHTEIELILANGKSVDFNYKVQPLTVGTPVTQRPRTDPDLCRVNGYGGVIVTIFP